MSVPEDEERDITALEDVCSRRSNLERCCRADQVQRWHNKLMVG